MVADHVWTLTFALSDGGVPNNVGRGYVLRRILRRGARYARKKLGVPIGSFFSSLMPVVVETMVCYIPSLKCSSFEMLCFIRVRVSRKFTVKVDEIKEILDEEEESFFFTNVRSRRKTI